MFQKPVSHTHIFFFQNCKDTLFWDYLGILHAFYPYNAFVQPFSIRGLKMAAGGKKCTFAAERKPHGTV